MAGKLREEPYRALVLVPVLAIIEGASRILGIPV